MIKVTGRSVLQSAATGERFDIEPSELEWLIGDRGVKRIGNEVHHVAHVERKTKNGSVISCDWTIAEFPPGQVTHTGHHSMGCIVVENFSFTWTRPGPA